MWYPAQVRTTALTLLQTGITTAGATFFTSKDTPAEGAGDDLAREIIVYTDSRKTGIGTAPPTFRTEVLTVVEIMVEADDKNGAETLSDTLCETCENLLLGDPTFVRLFESIDSVEWSRDVRGVDTERHTFVSIMEIKGRISERFEPTLPALTGLNVYVDSVSNFDPAGIEAPPFNYPVAAAPREAGPDGRAEASGKIDL